MAGRRVLDTYGAALTSIQTTAESPGAAQAGIEELVLEECVLVTTDESVSANQTNVGRKLEEVPNLASVETPPFTVFGEFGTDSVESVGPWERFPDTVAIKSSSREAAQAILNKLSLEGCVLGTTDESVSADPTNVGRKLEEVSNLASVETPPFTVSGEFRTDSVESVGPWERFPDTVAIKSSSREAAQAVLNELAIEGCILVSTDESVKDERANIEKILEEVPNLASVETSSFTVFGEFRTDSVESVGPWERFPDSVAIKSSSREAAQAVLNELAIEGCILVSTDESVKDERANIEKILEEVPNLASVETPPFTVSGEFGTNSVETPESVEIKHWSLDTAQKVLEEWMLWIKNGPMKNG